MGGAQVQYEHSFFLLYCAKFAPSVSLTPRHSKKFTVRGPNDDSTSLKAVQYLIINSTERDYSAQETCYLLLQLPMFRSSRDFIVLSVDGSRVVEDHLEEGQPATLPSMPDHYAAHPTTPPFSSMTHLHFAQQYTMPGSYLLPRRKLSFVHTVLLTLMVPNTSNIANRN